ncbi:hypothetical protein PoB_001503500 [Plakobranchus ocellatus]|uniref:Uncharacterized protein n=1 Tax=Plakobranchus ocellatus TaxID=259542 RepID=A0AAV3Z002_9GAST|nr:hypothetical protein PoB_001503500 [Plakobranchus ocellatus]
MGQSVIHHPLKGLTQAARERNRSIVGRIRGILTEFWIWNHRSLTPKWGNVPRCRNAIKKFKENMQAGFRKMRGAVFPRETDTVEETGCSPGAATAPPQACIPAGPQQPIAIDSACKRSKFRQCDSVPEKVRQEIFTRFWH